GGGLRPDAQRARGGEPGHGAACGSDQDGRRGRVFPPGDRRMKVSVQREDFDLGAEVRAISRNTKTGAVASFVGLVRDVRMTLEHYPGMTQTAIRKIVDEAAGRWQVMDCAVIHRFGDLEPNDQIVLVAVA